LVMGATEFTAVAVAIMYFLSIVSGSNSFICYRRC